MNRLYEYIGCIHVHSEYSDGSGSYPEIITACLEVGLDFVMMSDHMNMLGKEKGFDGWHHNLFVSIGYEINDPDDQHHYLAFGLDKILPHTLNHEKYIKRVHESTALGIAAHPFEERGTKSLPGFPAITWKSLDYPEIRVIELWNMMSHWLESTTLKNRYWNVIHPRSFSTLPSEKLRHWWDETNLERKVTAVGSVDVHAKKVKLFGLFSKAIFDYKVMFKSIRTHILTETPISRLQKIKEVEKNIFDSILGGKSFISNYRRGNAKGFRFWIEGDNTVAQIGGTCISKNTILRSLIPKRAVCKVIRNGELYHVEICREIILKIPEGVYRLEIEKDNRGWIYTNHIRIKKP